MRLHIQKILRHSTFYGLSNLFVSLTSLILIPIYTRFLGPDEYGVYSLIVLFSTLILYFYDMGMHHALVRHYLEAEDEGERKRILSTALWFFVGIAMFFSVILFLGSKTISHLILGGTRYANLIRLTVVIVLFNAIAGVSTTLLRIKEKSRLFMCLFGLKALGTIFLTYVFLAVLKRGLNGVFESALIAAGLFLVIISIFTIKDYGFSFSSSYLKNMLRFGIPLWLAMFFGWIIDFSDRFILRWFLTLEDVGLYSLGYKLGQIVYMVVMAFIMCWHPFLFNVIKGEDAPKILARLSTYAAAGFMFMCLALSIFSREAISLMATSAYRDSYKVIPFISFSYYMFGIYSIFLSGLLISKKVYKQPLILGLSAGLNIILNILLIPYLGIIGAAVATVLTYLVASVCTYFVAQRSYAIPYNLKELSFLTAAGISVFILGMLPSFESQALSLVVKGLVLAVFPAGLFAMGIFKKRDFGIALGRVR